MRPFTLDMAVREPGGRVLLPKGTLCTPEALQTLAAHHKTAEGATVSLLQCGTVRQDIVELLAASPYRVIFDDPLMMDTVLRLLERVILPAGLRPFLRHFERHAPETYHHILRVTALTAIVGRFLPETVHDLPQGILAAAVHDFGKFCLPVGLLEKRTPLTPRERGLLEQHTLAGYVLIGAFLGNHNSLPARAARDHHERRDGSGYPLGTRQENRMVEIIAVSDIYDALVSDRSYRDTAYENREALEEITGMAEAGKVGWEVVRALISFNRQAKPAPEACVVSGEKRTAAPPQGGDVGGSPEDEPA